MQRISNWCTRRFNECFSSRTAVLLLGIFVYAFCFNVHTRWAKTLFCFFVLPVMIGMSYTYIRDKAIRMDGVFRLVCISQLWLLMSTMINSFWSTGGMVGHWFMLGCWFFALFIPRKNTMQDIHNEIFKIGMIYIVCFLPFILLALYSVFTGKVIYVPWDHTPVGVQQAGNFGSRVRIMMNPNKIGIILVFNIFFSIYGLVVRKKKLWRAFFIFVIIVNAMASAHVMSRTSIMGLAAAMGLFGFRFAYQKLGRKKILAIAAGILACVLVFFLVVYGMTWIFQADVAIAHKINNAENYKEVQSRFESQGTFNATGTGRDEVWGSVISLIKEEPLGLIIGYGSEDVMQMAEDASGIRGMSDMGHVHSSYLDAVIRGGIPYLLMVLAFLIILIKPAWQIGMEKSTEETKGLFVIPMFIVSLLVMSISEVMLFVDRSHTNILFMVMCGYLLHYKNLQKEGRISA